VEVVVESCQLEVVVVSYRLEVVVVSYRLEVVVVSYRLEVVVEVALLSQWRLWLLALVVSGSLGPLCLLIGLALKHPS
jgi:hypothetical protein